ncbi:integrase core domain-containing protein [Streptomyces sp. NPDC004787]
MSVGRTGQCWDNALAESFFATLKNELVDTRPWPRPVPSYSSGSRFRW